MEEEELLALENIRVKVHATDWRDAIRQAGAPLVQSGSIAEAYVDDMIRAVEELGPYMVIMPGFALAHAAPCEAVRKNDASLITLDSPVEFGSRENDPVSVVLCICCTDRDAHRASMRRMATMVLGEGVMDRINAATAPEQIQEIAAGY